MRKVAIEFGYSPELVKTVLETYNFENAGELVTFLFDNEDVIEIETPSAVESHLSKEPTADRNLLQETSRLYAETLCSRCKHAPRERLLLPCSHFALCNYCYYTTTRCPLCEEEFRDSIRTFMA